MTRFTENPPWVDDLLTENWSELTHAVDPGLLPYATIARPAGATTRRRAARVTVTPAAELGCGSFGCVMATRTEGIVCKVTSDPSEAAFVETAWEAFGRTHRDGWPKGIVRYYKIIGLSPERVKTDTVRGGHRVKKDTLSPGAASATWMLWRDEAWGVDRAIDLLPTATVETLKRIKHHAMNIRTHVGDAPDDLSAALSLWRRGEAPAGSDDPRGLARLGLRGPERLAASLRGYETAISALRGLDAVRDALETLLEHGMVLADVRPANLGRSTPDGGTWVITDPGLFVSIEAPRRARGTRT